MKTYACPGCGDRYQVTTDYETDCQNCGREMHALDGIVRGGGVMAIWRDGHEVWSGTGFDAVELLQKLIHGGIHQVCEQSAEADRIVREMAAIGTELFSGVIDDMFRNCEDAREYVKKYPKT